MRPLPQTHEPPGACTQVLAALFLCFCWLCPPRAQAGGDEVRILIDVSGSMKQTDPRNLRVPALKLLLELLPPDTRAGVWLFAENTEPLIAPAPAAVPWKEEAAQAAGRIHARGLYTDIEGAIQNAIDDWQKPTGEHGRHLILLTDGMVDLSGGPDTDEASRSRILTKLLPHLQQLGIHAYTVALSERADHDLLKQLAVATDGWNETADSAEQLQRVFLRIFRKAVPRDTLPLEDNRFRIDSSVREFSLLVFRKAGSPTTELVKPSGQRWRYDNHPETVRWHHEEGYDLITAAEPTPGEWRLIAEVDPDNQVTIVTDLRLRIAPLPNYLLEGEPLRVRAVLTDHDQPITSENFLRLVELRLQRDGKETWSLSPDAEEAGVFTHTLDTTTPGTHSLRLTVDGRTFQRIWEQNIEILPPPVAVEVVPAQDGNALTLRLTPDANLIDPAGFQATAVIGEGEKTQERELTATGDGRWEASIDPPARSLSVAFRIQASSREGRPLAVKLKPVTIDPLPAAGEDDELLAEETLLEEESASPPWLLSAAIAATLNLVLGLAGFLAWRWSRRRLQQRHEALLNRLAE